MEFYLKKSGLKENPVKIQPSIRYVELREQVSLTKGVRESCSRSSGRIPVKNTTDKREVEPASSLNKRLGLPFSNLSLLTRALTHRSYANENPDATSDNERLEFLGDAVLDFVVGEWAYHRFPDLPEGDLTRIRSELVKNKRLAVFARRLDLQSALRLGVGEQASGGDKRDKLLGSALEAVIGALYLDAGIEAVKHFMNPQLEWMRDTILEEILDPKSELQELTQSHKMGRPEYRVLASSGPDHARVYEVGVFIAGELKGQGTASNKRGAEMAAAKNALEKIKTS